MTNLEIGYLGQKIAENYLKKNGYTILKKNYRAGIYGEIDLVAKAKGTKNLIVFVEVKTRTSGNFGAPEDSITPYKVRNMKRCATHFIVKNRISASLRFDVISVMLLANRTGKTHHFINCFN